MALPAYRTLLRSAYLAFKGDASILTAAVRASHDSFWQNRDAQGEEAESLVKHALEVAHVLRSNVVQGVKADPEADELRYRLRIHEHIERGDNESVKLVRPKGEVDSGTKIGCYRGSDTKGQRA